MKEVQVLLKKDQIEDRSLLHSPLKLVVNRNKIENIWYRTFSEQAVSFKFWENVEMLNTF